MVANDAKLFDFERLLAAWARMVENDAKLIDLECLLAAWAQNDQKLR